MFEITTAVGSIKSAIEIAKLLKDSADSLDKAEVKLKLAELMGALADTKMQIAEIQESLIQSEKEKKDLLEKIEVKESLIYEQPYYWKNITNGNKDGPYCQTCYDSQNKLIRLQNEGLGEWKCFSCEKLYTDKDYTPINYYEGLDPYDDY